MRNWAPTLLLLIAVGCVSAAPAPDGDVAIGSSDTSGATSSGGTTSTTVGPDRDDGANGSPSLGEGGDVGRGEVRFIALGDAGEGNDAQYAVARAAASVCEERGCDLALYLGDNFYEVGVTSDTDPQFLEKFELPYLPLDLPFYVTLGNHDLGVLGNDWSKTDLYVSYGERNPKWVLPSAYYSFQHANAHFVSLDTNQVFWDEDTEAQAAFLREDLAGLDGTWKIAFGHHPYISNGDHGNAGHYEGLGGLLGGANVKSFVAEHVCGKFHLYISGHDHSRQWLLRTCGTEFLISGAGAKLTELPRRDNNPSHFEEVATEGFLWVEIVDDTLTGAFYDRNAVNQFERTITL